MRLRRWHKCHKRNLPNNSVKQADPKQCACSGLAEVSQWRTKSLTD